jgi:hypothetical protein
LDEVVGPLSAQNELLVARVNELEAINKSYESENLRPRPKQLRPDNVVTKSAEDAVPDDGAGPGALTAQQVANRTVYTGRPAY